MRPLIQRNLILAFTLIGAAASTSVMAFLCVTVSRIDASIQALQVTHEVKAVQQTFLVAERYQAAQLLCTGSDQKPVCQAVTRHLYPELGEHSPLWVVLDALSIATRGRCADSRLPAMEGWLAILEALADGLPGEFRRQQAEPAIYAIDLYFMMLAQAQAQAQARACHVLTRRIGCKNGLPIATYQALENALTTLQRIGLQGNASLIASQKRAIAELMHAGYGRVPS